MLSLHECVAVCVSLQACGRFRCGWAVESSCLHPSLETQMLQFCPSLYLTSRVPWELNAEHSSGSVIRHREHSKEMFYTWKRDVYRELLCRGDAVQQSQWKLGAAQCLCKLTCVMYVTLGTEGLPSLWCCESVTAGTVTCISWWEKVHFQPSMLIQPFHFH